MNVVFELVPYLVVLMAGALAVLLLTSKAVSEKLVAVGLLPRAFLSFTPIIQKAMRLFGIALVTAGIVGIGIQSGWINREYLARYGFPTALLLLGVIVIVLSSQRDR